MIRVTKLVLKTFIIVLQAEEMIENIFSSFKSKLHELKGTNPKSLQSVVTKVTYEARIDIVYINFTQ